MFASGAWRIAREDLLDGVRQRSVVLTLVFAPLAVWLVVGLVPVLFQTRSESSDANLHATVAVSRNAPPAVLASLRSHLKVVVRTDPAASVSNDEADAAMIFAGDPRAELRAGHPLRARELTSTGRSKGRMTLGLAEGALEDLRAGTGGAPKQLVTTIAVADPDEARGLISRALPMLFVVSLAGIIQLAATRFLGGRSLRTLEMILVRPVTRTGVLAGLALSSMLMGLMGSALMLTPVMLAAAVVSASGKVGGTIAVLVLVVAVEAWMFSAVGIALAVSGRSLNDARVRATVTTSLVTLVGLVMGFSGTVANTRVLHSIPITDALVLIRHAVIGSATAGECAHVVVTSLLVSALCFVVARRYIDSERVATRA